jgi:hypothetical protein
VKRITNLGSDPWQVRELNGTVRFKRVDAARMKVTALDFNSYPTGRTAMPEKSNFNRRLFTISSL